MTSGRHSKPSLAPAGVCTNLSQLGASELVVASNPPRIDEYTLRLVPSMTSLSLRLVTRCVGGVMTFNGRPVGGGIRGDTRVIKHFGEYHDGPVIRIGYLDYAAVIFAV